MAEILILEPGDGLYKNNLPSEGKQVVELLISHHGDVQMFAQFFSDDLAIQQHIIYRAEQILRRDDLLYQEWNDAIRSHHLSRLRIIQVKALDTIEGFLDCKVEDKTATAKTNIAKLVLGGLFASEVQMGRSSKSVERITVGDTENSEDEDEASYQRAQNA